MTENGSKPPFFAKAKDTGFLRIVRVVLLLRRRIKNHSIAAIRVLVLNMPIVGAGGDRGGVHRDHLNVAILLLWVERLAVRIRRRAIGVGVV